MKRANKYERQAELRQQHVQNHRIECARIMRTLRNTIQKGQTFDLPDDRTFYRISCAVKYLGWKINGSRSDEKVTATRP